MRPIITGLAVALLVVLAGCGAAGTNVDSQSTSASNTNGIPSGSVDEEGDDSSSSGSPTESSGTDPSVPVPPAESFPAGTSIDGIVDPSAIVVAHLGHLEDSTYTSTWTETYTAAEYTYATTNTRLVDGTRQLKTVDYSGQYQEVYRGSNDSPNYIRWETEQGVRYLIDHGDVLFLGESTFFVQSLLEAATFEFVRHEDTDDGSVFVFAITDFELTADLQSATPLETVDDLQGTVSVRNDGLIRQLSGELSGPDPEGVQTELQVEQTISGVGTTSVSEPVWLAEAEERAAVMAAEMDGEGRYIEITMKTGDEIPAGSQGFIYVGDLAVETEFEEGIAPGQSFYLYESTTGELTVEFQAPASDDVGAPVPDEVSEVSVAIFHQDIGTVYVSTLELGASSS